jgi:hypothetical protein
VALAIFALAAIAIISVDISKLLVTRVQLQNAADAGALAGARMFMDSQPPTDVDIIVEAKDIAGVNKAFALEGDEPIPRDNITVTVDMEDQIVGVTTRSQVSQYFLGVTSLGIGPGDVSAYAAASFAEICNVICLKPFSIPDRHDDFNAPAYYADAWNGNGLYDQENFTDTNKNRAYDFGEAYEDLNSNFVFDQEFYDPLLTGYIASKDHGLQLELKANNSSKPEPSQYWPVDLPDENGDSRPGASWFRWNIGNCNPWPVKPGDYLWTEDGNMVGPTSQGMENLIDQDPNAHWDEGCECIQDSDFGISPRIGLIPLHDPRMPIVSGKVQLLVTKVAAFFIEEQRSDGTVVGRFLKVQGPGDPCEEGETNGGFVWNLSLIE